MIHKYQTKFQVKNETETWHDSLKWSDTEVFIKTPQKDETWSYKTYKFFFESYN